jgi:hypothetical protein
LKISGFNRVALLGWLFSLSGQLHEAAQAQSFLAVQKQPPVIRKHFMATTPPQATGDHWSSNDRDTAFWSFTFRSDVDGDVVSAGQVGAGWRAKVFIKRATVKLGLLMDIFLGEHPSPSEIERGEAYAMICERIYKDAGSTVDALTESLYAYAIESEGSDREKAVSRALTKAKLTFDICYFYNANLKAQRVTRAFDFVSSRSKVSLAQAVDQAFVLADKYPQYFNKRPRRPRPAVSGRHFPPPG